MKKLYRHLIAEIEWLDSIIGLVGVCVILAAAIFMQFFYGEAPCPLCLLQRAAFVGVGIAMLMNVRFGNKASHWALAIICACTGITVSIRQMLLHITTVQGFGSAILGMHMYTWCFIGFSAVIVGSAFMLLLYPEKKDSTIN
tara:strand:+ start:6268 stop:6693 length:426 start_codon:yes stop_codon:yes gene_type:complete